MTKSMDLIEWKFHLLQEVSDVTFAAPRPGHLNRVWFKDRCHDVQRRSFSAMAAYLLRVVVESKAEDKIKTLEFLV